MKNYSWLLLLVPLLSFCTSRLAAQSINSCFTLELEATSGSPGDIICVDITSKNFNSIISSQYSIHWNALDLRYSAIENLNLPSLTFFNFNASSELIDAGMLTFSWVESSLQGVDMEEETPLFSICFEIIGQDAGFSPISFSDTPTPIEFINSSFQEVGANLIGGGIYISANPDTPPLHIEDGCVAVEDCAGGPFSASIDLSIVGGVSPYTIEWTGPNGYTATEASVSNLSVGTYTVVVTDSTGTQTSAIFEVGNSGTIQDNANITPTSCGGVNSGAIDINPTGGSGSFSYTWSTGETTQDISGLAEGTYQVTISDVLSDCFSEFEYVIGYEDFLWASTYECFEDSARVSVVIWSGGTAPYTFDWNDGTTEVSSLASMSVLPLGGSATVTVTDQSGCSEVIGPITPDCDDQVGGGDGLTVYATHHDANEGDTVCVDIRVTDFENINSAQFTLDWNPNIAEFYYISEFGLPELDLTNFGIVPPLYNAGKIPFSWFDETLEGVTVDDHTTIFQVCFIVQTNSGITGINIADDPTIIEFIDVGFQEVPATINNGSITVGTIDPNPPALALIIEDAISAPGEEVCIPVVVGDFNRIQSIHYNHTWDAAVLDFSHIQLGNLPNLSTEDFN